MLLTSAPKLDMLVLFLTIFALSLFILTRDFNYWKKRKIPYVTPIPFVGSILPIIRQKKSIGQYLDQLYTESKRLKHGLLGFWICHSPCLFIDDLDIIKHILVKDFAYFADRVVASKSKNDPLGTNMIFGMKQPHWNNMRTRLSPLFTSQKIKQMFECFSRNTKKMETLIDNMIKYSDTETMDVKNICTRYTVDNIIEATIGTVGNCLTVDWAVNKVDDSPIKKAASAMMEDSPPRSLEFTTFFLAPEIVSWFNFKFFDEAAANFLRKVFWDAYDHRIRSNENGKHGDLLDKLINFKENNIEIDGLKYDNDTLVAQFVVMFVAGFETSSTSMALALHHLAWRSDIQTRVREEISMVKSRYDGQLTYEALNDLTYLDMVYREILRLYPTLPFLDRLCMRDYKLPDRNLTIEKGTKLYISLSSIQRDPNYWNDPDVFDPERFSAENKSKIVPFSYLPFGEGRRICIGERVGLCQSKLGLASILSTYFIEKAENTKEYPEFSTMNTVTTPSPIIKLKFIRDPIK